MLVHREINQLPSFKNSVITIGAFDGVHTGHLQIIKLLKQEATRVNGESVIITFHPHPRMIVGNPAPDTDIPQPTAKTIGLLNTPEEKIELIEKNGIDHLVIVPFTESFSLLSAEEYIKEFLVRRFHPHTIIIGHDHRFGKQRQGDYALLEANAQKFNYRVNEIPEHVMNNVAISSTLIRKAILNADMQTANKCLGYTFFFEGVVVEGDKLGRRLGFPTANLEVAGENKILPADGVYAVEVSVPHQDGLWRKDDAVQGSHTKMYRWKGMMNIGYRPTIGGLKKVTEVNIFDFDADIYGKYIRVFVKKHLRAEKKFDGLESLKAQLSADKANAIKIFENGDEFIYYDK